MWVHQHPDFGLGNFINLTPAIFYLAMQDNGRVPVYFSTPYVRECFLDCPFMEHLDEMPDTAPAFSSAMTNQANDRPDFEYIFKVLTGQQWRPGWLTYVDKPEAVREMPHIVIINGAGNPDPRYTAKKDLGEAVYRHVRKVVDGRYPIVAVGSFADLERAPYMAQVADVGCWGNIRRALGYIGSARCVISNDSGLAHAAGAMQNRLLVLWKDTTERERCKNAGHYSEYAHKDHETAVFRFLAHDLQSTPEISASGGMF